MFQRVDINIINVESLKNLDVSDVNNFSAMFSSCESLTNLDFLEKWNISKGEKIFWNVRLLSFVIKYKWTKKLGCFKGK